LKGIEEGSNPAGGFQWGVMLEKKRPGRWAPPVSGEKEKEKKGKENGSGR
jgi:hypothetical protein